MIDSSDDEIAATDVSTVVEPLSVVSDEMAELLPVAFILLSVILGLSVAFSSNFRYPLLFCSSTDVLANSSFKQNALIS